MVMDLDVYMKLTGGVLLFKHESMIIKLFLRKQVNHDKHMSWK